MKGGKIFIRKRRRVEEGEKEPRFAIVAVSGVEISFKVRHIRKMEIEQIAEEVGAELVLLKAGKAEEDDA